MVPDAAKHYLARGWSVLPLRPRDKRPLISWEHLQKERPCEGDIAEWFRRWPNANIGIVTGEISNLIVLDVDPKHGGDASLERLERRFGPLSTTVEAATGGGGRHLYFAHPGYLTTNRAGLVQGIDLRGDGGFVVAPPSIHPSGHPYAWRPGRSPDEITLAPPPRWCILPRSPRIGRSLSEWRRLVREGVAEGQRNSTIASLTGHLLWHGVDTDVALELLLAWKSVSLVTALKRRGPSFAANIALKAKACVACATEYNIMSEFWCERSLPRPRELRMEMCQWESRNKGCLTLLEGMQFDHGFFALASNNAENTEIEEWLVRISNCEARSRPRPFSSNGPCKRQGALATDRQSGSLVEP